MTTSHVASRCRIVPCTEVFTVLAEHPGHLRLLFVDYTDRDELWAFLQERRGTIEAKLGALEWDRREAYHKILRQRDADMTDRERWAEYQDWLIRYGEAFDHVLGVAVAEFER